MTSTLKRAWQLTPVFLPGEPPWTEEPGGLQSIGFQRVGHDWSDLARTHVRSRRMSREVAQMCPTVAYQAPPSMEFSRQEYWSGLPFPSPGRSSWPRDQTHVSHIGGRRFTIRATREAFFSIVFCCCFFFFFPYFIICRQPLYI